MRNLILITLVLLCSACGQTGNLYLPESEASADTSPIEIQAETEAPNKEQIESELKAQNAG